MPISLVWTVGCDSRGLHFQSLRCGSTLNQIAQLLTVRVSLVGTANTSQSNSHMTSLAATLPAAAVAANLHVLLPITLTTAAFSAVFQLVLTTLIIRQRLRAGVHLLDGGDAPLTRRIRAHANFTETVPLALLLMLLLELAGWSAGLLTGSAGLLVAGRLLHAHGILVARAGVSRRLGMALTLISHFLMAVGGAWLVFGPSLGLGLAR
jgi:uncharacterized protein